MSSSENCLNKLIGLSNDYHVVPSQIPYTHILSPKWEYVLTVCQVALQTVAKALQIVA